MSDFYFVMVDQDGTFATEDPYQFTSLLDAIDEAKRTLAEMAADGIPQHSGEVLAVVIQNAERRSVVRLVLELKIEYVDPNSSKADVIIDPPQ